MRGPGVIEDWSFSPEEACCRSGNLEVEAWRSGALRSCIGAGALKCRGMEMGCRRANVDVQRH